MQVKRFFGAIGRAACYLGLFVGVQFICMLIYSLVVGVICSFSILSSTAPHPNDYYDGYDDGYVMEDYFDEGMYDEIYDTYMADMGAIVTIASAGITLFLLFIFFRARRKTLSAETHWRKSPPFGLIGPFSLGFGLNIFASLLLTLLIAFLPTRWMEDFSENSALLEGSNPALMVLATVVAAPFVEEVLFRGLIYTRLREGMPRIAAILVSSVVFGAMHGTPVHLLYTIPLAILMCLVYERYGSLWACILLHAGFNLSAVVIGSMHVFLLLGIGFVVSALGLYLTLSTSPADPAPVYKVRMSAHPTAHPYTPIPGSPYYANDPVGNTSVGNMPAGGYIPLSVPSSDTRVGYANAAPASAGPFVPTSAADTVVLDSDPVSVSAPASDAVTDGGAVPASPVEEGAPETAEAVPEATESESQSEA